MRLLSLYSQELHNVCAKHHTNSIVGLMSKTYLREKSRVGSTYVGGQRQVWGVYELGSVCQTPRISR